MTSFRPPTEDSLTGGDFDAPLSSFRVARVHAEDFGGEEGGFVASGFPARIFEDDPSFSSSGSLGEQQKP